MIQCTIPTRQLEIRPRLYMLAGSLENSISSMEALISRRHVGGNEMTRLSYRCSFRSDSGSASMRLSLKSRNSSAACQYSMWSWSARLLAVRFCLVLSALPSSLPYLSTAPVRFCGGGGSGSLAGRGRERRGAGLGEMVLKGGGGGGRRD